VKAPSEKDQALTLSGTILDCFYSKKNPRDCDGFLYYEVPHNIPGCLCSYTVDSKEVKNSLCTHTWLYSMHLKDLANSKVLEIRPVYECCRLYEVKACSTVL
jgi:hypothetical protein